jgi:hypothetical protein
MMLDISIGAIFTGDTEPARLGSEDRAGRSRARRRRGASRRPLPDSTASRR